MLADEKLHEKIEKFLEKVAEVETNLPAGEWRDVSHGHCDGLSIFSDAKKLSGEFRKI